MKKIQANLITVCLAACEAERSSGGGRITDRVREAPLRRLRRNPVCPEEMVLQIIGYKK